MRNTPLKSFAKGSPVKHETQADPTKKEWDVSADLKHYRKHHPGKPNQDGHNAEGGHDTLPEIVKKDE